MKNIVEFKGCLTSQGFIKPPGRAYLLILPIMLELPILRGRNLFVHRSLPGHGTVWTVTDGETGRRIASGKTRAAAGEAAQAVLLQAGPERLANAFRLGSAAEEYRMYDDPLARLRSEAEQRARGHLLLMSPWGFGK